MKTIVSVNATEFDNVVLKGTGPVVVDFWAPWCGPCKMIAPLLDEVARDNPTVQVVKVNVDEQPELAAKYQVQGIPTLLFFNNGELKDKSVGAVAKRLLQAKVQSLSAPVVA